MSSVRVTIGIPFYNCESVLPNAIRSVFSQSFQDWELILVDDGSTDCSLEIARLVNDPRVRAIGGSINRGLPYRLNQIAQEARGEYIARMDADDLMHPERLAQQVQYLDTHPTVDIVCSAAFTIDDDHNLTGIKDLSGLDVRPKTVLKRGLAIHPTITGRSAWFRRNPYNGEFLRAQDHELWCRTCGNSTFAKLRQPLYFYKEDNGVSVFNYLSSCRSDREIFKRHGPSMVGWPNVVTLVTKSYIKGEIYRIFTAIGKQQLLINMRNAPVCDREREVAMRIIKGILATHVPGFPPKIT